MLSPCGHIPIPHDQMYQRKCDLDRDAIKEAEEMLFRNVPQPVVNELLEVKTGHTISDSSMRNLKKDALANKFMKSEGESNAETLLRMMEQDTNIHYCAYLGDYSEAEKCVRVRKRSSKKKRKSKKLKTSNKSSVKEPLVTSDDDECEHRQ